MKIFHTTDTELKRRNGQEITVLGPPDANDYEPDETGPMWRVRFNDGYETAAFEDEITQAKG